MKHCSTLHVFVFFCVCVLWLSLAVVGKGGQNFICKPFSKKTVLVPVGEIDLEMLSQLRLKHPGVTVDNEVVEPSGQQLHSYRGTAFINTHLTRIPQIDTISVFLCPRKSVSRLNLTANESKIQIYFALYYYIILYYYECKEHILKLLLAFTLINK